MLIAAIVAALFALVLAQPSIALPGLAPSTPAKVGQVKHDPCIGHDTTAKQAGPFIERVWRLIRWARQKPKPSTVRAYRDKLRCAGPENRKALKHRWREAQRAFYAHRRAMLETIRWEPYVCGDRRYALLCDVTECESGFNFGYTSGAYGLLQSTWEYWGGLRFAPYPGAATPREQAIIARTVWEAVGPGGWECPL